MRSFLDTLGKSIIVFKRPNLFNAQNKLRKHVTTQEKSSSRISKIRSQNTERRKSVMDTLQ